VDPERFYRSGEKRIELGIGSVSYMAPMAAQRNKEKKGPKGSEAGDVSSFVL
jgi:hypothetical protein